MSERLGWLEKVLRDKCEIRILVEDGELRVYVVDSSDDRGRRGYAVVKGMTMDKIVGSGLTGTLLGFLADGGRDELEFLHKAGVQ